jgi:hypothetical protein
MKKDSEQKNDNKDDINEIKLVRGLMKIAFNIGELLLQVL